MQVLALSMEDVAAIASGQPQGASNLDSVEKPSPRAVENDDNDAASTMSRGGTRAETRSEESGRYVDGDASAATLEPALSGTDADTGKGRSGMTVVNSGVWLGRAGRSGQRLQTGLDLLRSSQRKEAKEARRRMDGMQVLVRIALKLRNGEPNYLVRTQFNSTRFLNPKIVFETFSHDYASDKPIMIPANQIRLIIGVQEMQKDPDPIVLNALIACDQSFVLGLMAV